MKTLPFKINSLHSNPGSLLYAAFLNTEELEECTANGSDLHFYLKRILDTDVPKLDHYFKHMQQLDLTKKDLVDKTILKQIKPLMDNLYILYTLLSFSGYHAEWKKHSIDRKDFIEACAEHAAKTIILAAQCCDERFDDHQRVQKFKSTLSTFKSITYRLKDLIQPPSLTAFHEISGIYGLSALNEFSITTIDTLLNMFPEYEDSSINNSY